MSSIIQAFFIEPVIRQARKFSGLDDGSSSNSNTNRTTVKPAPPHDPHPLSHASTGEDAPRHRNHHHNLHNVHVDEHGTYPPVNRLGHAFFDRFAPLVPASFARPLDSLPAAHVGSVRPRSTTTSTPPPASHPPLPDANVLNTLLVAAAADAFDPADLPLPASPTCSSPSTLSLDLDDILMADSNPAFRTPERRRSRERPSPQTPSPRLSRANSSTGRPSRAHSRRNIYPLTERSDANKTNNLPADDGMQSLRQRIHEIRELAISSEEKAKRMHDLMTRDWNALRAQQRPKSPESLAEGTCCAGAHADHADRPCSPGSPAWMKIDSLNPFNLHPDDLKPSYRPQSDPDSPIESPPPSPDSGDSQPPLSRGCVHYKRNVKIQCYDCKKWYPCRHCHDEAEETDHALNRRKTENMLCMLCLTPQAAGQNCNACGEQAAYYYCEICKLWDDDATKRIYHCVDCGICRRGEGIGKDFVHCKKCNVCISIAFASSHRCIERATDCDCPICSDYMFTSPQDIVAMPCGHYMHHTCYTEYMQREYRCPICKKSAVNMELQWRKLESAIEGQPMPAQWRDVRAEVRCNDCGGRGVGRYHWLGNKCGTCDGFNTNEIRLIGANEGARREAEQYAEGERRVAARSRAASSERVPLANSTSSPSLSRSSTTTSFAQLQLQPLTQAHPVRTRAQLLQPRDYFASNFDQPRRPSSGGPAAPRGDHPTDAAARGLSLPNPYEMLARMSRSLSPIRHYFDEHLHGAEGGAAVGQGRGEGVHGPGTASAETLPLPLPLPSPHPHPYSLNALMRPRSADATLLNPPSSSSAADASAPQHQQAAQHIRSRSWALTETLGLWGEGWLFNSSDDEGGDSDDDEGEWSTDSDDEEGQGVEFEEDWESSDDDDVGFSAGGGIANRGRRGLGGGLRLIGHR